MPGISGVLPLVVGTGEQMGGWGSPCVCRRALGYLGRTGV